MFFLTTVNTLPIVGESTFYYTTVNIDLVNGQREITHTIEDFGKKRLQRMCSFWLMVKGR